MHENCPSVKLLLFVCHMAFLIESRDSGQKKNPVFAHTVLGKSKTGTCQLPLKTKTKSVTGTMTTMNDISTENFHSKRDYQCVICLF